MIGLGLSATKGSFFDADRVIRLTSVAERRSLSRVGAFLRRRARSSIRKRKKSAPPGSPPSSHRGDLKRLLFFAFDPSSWSVVVGPVPFDAPANQTPRAPRALEKGAVVTRVVEVPAARAGRKATPAQAKAFKRLVRQGRVKVPPRQKQQRAFVYEPRPFMLPSLLAEVAAGTIAESLRGSIRG